MSTWVPGPVLHLMLMLFNHQNTSADTSNFEEETEAYKFQFRIKLKLILTILEWSARLYRIWPPPPLKPSPLFFSPPLIFAITLQSNWPMGPWLGQLQFYPGDLALALCNEREGKPLPSNLVPSSSSLLRSVTSSDRNPWTHSWK